MYKPPKAIEEFLLFLKRHIVICILCLLSGFIIAKYTNIPAPSWLPDSIAELLLRPQEETTAFDWLEILNNLSLAFIASIITYVVVQYIPERKKAYIAYAIMENDLQKLYSYLSYLISIYLFDIGINKPERDISLKMLSCLPNLGISDITKSSRIETVIDEEMTKMYRYGYNLQKDSIKYADLIMKTIGHIKESMCSAQMDGDIINTLSTIENNWFLSCFYDSNFSRFNMSCLQHRIANLDKGIFELIKCHLSLNKYVFSKLTYQIEKISDEEMKKEEEQKLFKMQRVLLKIFGSSEVETIAESIIKLDPTEDRLKKSRGVLFEILIYYDLEIQKPFVVLHEALKIAEYIRKNELDVKNDPCNLLNCLQIKKRLNSLSQEDFKKLESIISDTEMPNYIILEASIILGNDKRAREIFDQLSDEDKAYFTELPIYHLWNNPPIEANPNPRFFNAV